MEIPEKICDARLLLQVTSGLERDDDPEETAARRTVQGFIEEVTAAGKAKEALEVFYSAMRKTAREAEVKKFID
jgi:hypothetical protein